MSIFLRGFVIGFAIAAPVGAIGVLCISRTLKQGWLVGFVSGLGAATADGVYGCIAGLALTVVSHMLVEQRFWLNLIGGTFLCCLGIKTFFAKCDRQIVERDRSSLIEAYGSTFFLTLTNPMTILSFAAIFAGAGLANASGNYGSTLMMVIGVVIGSVTWWSILSSIISLVRNAWLLSRLHLLDRISGIVITAFGLLTLWRLN